MKPSLIATLAALCAPVSAEPATDAAIVTDPAKIIKSTVYDLGERLLTVQELTKEAMPMPQPIPQATVPAPTTLRPAFQSQKRATLNLSARIYKRANHPTRSFITYHIPGQQTPVTFWSSADWSLIAGIGNLTAPDGTVWQLMCMPSVIDVNRQMSRQVPQLVPDIPEMPAGETTCQIVTGNPTPEQMAPVALFHSHYDAHLPELQAAQQSRLAAQQRLANERLANPPDKQDITVQYRILAPDEIVGPAPAGTVSQP
jgi:hypothetical protein